MGAGYGGVVDLTGATAALQFFTGFLVEKSLSLDHIFVIARILSRYSRPTSSPSWACGVWAGPPGRVTEVLVVLAAGRETGFMVRDLRLFQDGHYYLPALSLVFRDVGDGECATDAFTAAEVPWTRLESDLRPETANSFWAFGEAADHAVAASTLERWYRLHDDAYFAELARRFPGLAPERGVAPEADLAASRPGRCRSSSSRTARSPSRPPIAAPKAARWVQRIALSGPARARTTARSPESLSASKRAKPSTRTP